MREKYGPAMEALLFAAARADHVDQLIRPVLDEGRVVLCDRFIDPSRAIRGYRQSRQHLYVGSGTYWVIDGNMPDMTIIPDIPAEKGLSRAGKRRGSETVTGSKEDIAVHEARRQAFLASRKQSLGAAVIGADQARKTRSRARSQERSIVPQRKGGCCDRGTRRP